MKKKSLPLVVAAALLAGCGSDSVPESEVEDLTRERMLKDYGDGVKVGDVDCPDGLAAEVGATMTCTATMNGEERDISLTVTRVDDDTAEFEYQIVE